MDSLDSFPTAPGYAKTEQMNDGFLKLHPGSPVHLFTKCNDTEYHTHPFRFTTHIILGGYIEELLVPGDDNKWEVRTYRRMPGTSHTIPVGYPHKLIGLIDGPCITRCDYSKTTAKPGFCAFSVDHPDLLFHRFHDSNHWVEYLTSTVERPISFVEEVDINEAIKKGGAVIETDTVLYQGNLIPVHQVGKFPDGSKVYVSTENGQIFADRKSSGIKIKGDNFLTDSTNATNS